MEDDEVIEIDPTVSAVLPDGGAVCCGAGNLGADGFFARLGANEQLVWVVVLRNSNPFHHIRVDGTLVAFTNNLGNSLTVNLADPEFL
jgi:NAD(P)H-hydrate repair Nnr-like enzyme with NAD(P)H-hydrate epimerase domain